MKIGVLIPYRGTDSDKSRLRRNIPSEMVKGLLHQMTQQVIDASTSLGKEYNTYLLTKNDSINFNGDYKILKDQGEELNESIDIALNLIEEEIILIVMADLPLIRTEDMKRVIIHHKEKGDVIIAPSKDNGTSLLCFDSNKSFPFVFGDNSAIKYQEFFSKEKIRFKLLEHEISYRDIDTFKDLSEIKEIVSIPKWLRRIVNAVM